MVADDEVTLCFADGSAPQFDFLIAADGAQSIARRALDRKDAPSFSKFPSHRGLPPARLYGLNGMTMSGSNNEMLGLLRSTQP